MEILRVHPDLFTAAEALLYLHLPADADRTLKTYRDKGWLAGWPVGPDGTLMYWREDLNSCALLMVGRVAKNKLRKPSVSDTDDPPPSVLTYFIREENGGRIKIGRTFDIRTRLETLQRACPAKLICIGLIDEDRELELHRRFAKHRQHGEWFDPAKEILEFINEHAAIIAEGTKC